MTVDQLKAPLDLLETGSPALDRILGGGLPARSITLIAGEPGAGKTILALQMLFHQARQGRRAFYFTTMAEPAVKLIRGGSTSAIERRWPPGSSSASCAATRRSADAPSR